MLIEKLKTFLINSGLEGETVFDRPPKSELGDLTLSCFALAKKVGKNPVLVAQELAGKITDEIESNSADSLLVKVEAIGPYVNFYLNSKILAELILPAAREENFGQVNLGESKKLMVEFAHPNTHKAFHIGHLRNIITGESIVRILQNANYQVVRANYQGDVGMHIAKCLWGIEQLKVEYEKAKDQSLSKRVEFLGRAYALGGQAYENGDLKIKEKIIDFNDKIYSQDESIKDVYQTTRQWSLDYFDHIYQRLGSHFDRLYFESEVFVQGKEIVLEFLDKGVFKKSQGAIIFEGSKYGLHDRVFINNKGFPTYEAKDMCLAEMQFAQYSPEKIIHVVGKEQAEYFKVIFKALEYTLPESIGREHHLNYGWVTLKEGKMSSRTGQVVLGEWLLDEIEKKIAAVMQNSRLNKKDEVIKKVALSAVKYAILKTSVTNDIKFDLDASISLTGDSGPYLLYIVARIKSILRQCQDSDAKYQIPNEIEPSEKKLLLRIDEYPEVAQRAAETLDPSKIARYLFDLAQDFNSFYDLCPVLKATDEQKNFRVQLIKKVAETMTKGLCLLGIETVEQM